MEKINRFIENYSKIAEISAEKQVDLEVACLMFVNNENLSAWHDEKESFDLAYSRWFQADFVGSISDYLEV